MRSWTGPVTGKSGTVNQHISVTPDPCLFTQNATNFCDVRWVYKNTFGWLFPTKVDFVVVLLFCGGFAIVYGSGNSTSSSFQTSWINRRQKTVKRLLKPTFVSSLLALGYLNAMASSGFSSNRPFLRFFFIYNLWNGRLDRRQHGYRVKMKLPKSSGAFVQPAEMPPIKRIWPHQGLARKSPADDAGFLRSLAVPLL